MTSTYHTPHSSNGNLDQAGINGPLGQLDQAIGNIISGVTTLVLKCTNFTNAQHDHEDAAGGGQLGLAALDVSAGSDGQVPTVSSGALALATPADVPIGTMLLSALSTAPTGYLLCDGAAVSRSTYADLFAAIGTTFGSGDGSTTFNVPDLRGRFPLGKDNMGGTSANRVTDADADTLGGADGDETKTLSVANLPAHDHDVWDGTFRQAAGANANNWHFAPTADQFSSTATAPKTGDTGSGTAFDVMNPFLAVNFIIKY